MIKLLFKGKTSLDQMSDTLIHEICNCSCGNVNWARRMTCNLCNAPKYGKQEQRTGIYYLLCFQEAIHVNLILLVLFHNTYY
jgi:hypothetical protein